MADKNKGDNPTPFMDDNLKKDLRRQLEMRRQAEENAKKLNEHTTEEPKTFKAETPAEDVKTFKQDSPAQLQQSAESTYGTYGGEAQKAYQRQQEAEKQQEALYQQEQQNQQNMLNQQELRRSEEQQSQQDDRRRQEERHREQRHQEPQESSTNLNQFTGLNNDSFRRMAGGNMPPPTPPATQADNRQD